MVDELLASAVAGGALAPAGDGWSVAGPIRPLVPESFAETVQRRLDDAGEPVRRILGIAALMGRRLDWRLVTRVAGYSPAEAHARLGQAVSLQLLVVQDDGFSFRHALTREAILDDLLPTERADLALRTLAALEQTEMAGEGWRHLAADLAEMAGEGDRAAVLLLEAGRSSLARGALATSAAALERAAGLAATPRLLADIGEALAEARSAAGDLSATRSASTRCSTP